MRGPESRLVDKLIKYLKKQGGWWVKIHGGIYQIGGLPDIIGCWRGQFYGIEVKTPKAYAKSGHNLTARQEAVLERISREGGVAGAVSSQDQLNALMKERVNNGGD